MAEKKLKKS